MSATKHIPKDATRPYDSGSLCGIPANRLAMTQITKYNFEVSCGTCARICARRMS